MEFYADGIWVLLHVTFAGLWLGAAAYQVFVIGPAMRASGPAGAGFLSTLIRMGRVSRFFGIAGGLAFLMGIIVYTVEDVGELGMEGRAVWINLGAASALVALVIGAAVSMPTERKMRALIVSLKGPPSSDQQQQMQALGMRLGKAGVLALTFISLAFLLMLMQRVFI